MKLGILWLSLLVVLTGCGKSSKSKSPPPVETKTERLEIVAVQGFNLVEGDTHKFEAAVFIDGADRTAPEAVQPTWDVTPGNLAKITSDGELTALAAGEVTVTAGYKDLKAKLVFTIVAKRLTLKIIGDGVDFRVGETLQLNARLTPEGQDEGEDVQPQWSVSPSDAARISETGLLTAIKAQDVEVKASFKGLDVTRVYKILSADAPPVTITSLSITAPTFELVPGVYGSLKTSATYSDGSTSTPADAQVQWYVTVGKDVAQFNADKKLQVLKAGKFTVSATFEGKTATIELTAGPAPITLTGLSITAPTGELAPGLHGPLKTSAVYSNGSTSTPADAEVQWDVTVGKDVAQFNAEKKLQILKAGKFTVSATFQGKTATIELTAGPAPITLTGLSITAPTGELVPGVYALKTVATYVDGSTSIPTESAVQWSVTVGKEFAEFNAERKLLVLKPGKFTVSATFQTKTATIELTAVPAPVTITSLSIIAPVGKLIPGVYEALKTLVTYSTGSTTTPADSNVQWDVTAGDDVAQFTAEKKLQILKAGKFTVSATFQGKTAVLELTAEPAPITITSLSVTAPTGELVPGLYGPLKTTATFSDGSSSTPEDAGVQWDVTVGKDVAQFNAEKKLRVLKAGKFTITATFQGKTAALELTAVAAPVVVTTLSITAPAGQLTPGVYGPLKTVATFSNGSTSNPVDSDVQWDVTVGKDVAQFNAEKKLQILKAGRFTVSATFQGKTAVLELTAVAAPVVVTALSITAPTGELIPGVYALKASATYSDGSTSTPADSEVQWAVAAGTEFAQFNADKKLQILKAGKFTVSASFQGKTATIELTAVAAPVAVTSLTITPPSGTLVPGIYGPLKTVAIFSDGTTSNPADADVKWDVTVGKDIAQFNADKKLQVLKAGEFTISAEFKGTTAALSLKSVVAVALKDFVILAPSEKLLPGTTYSIKTQATYTDGSTRTPADAEVQLLVEEGTEFAAFNSQKKLEIKGAGVFKITANFEGKTASRRLASNHPFEKLATQYWVHEREQGTNKLKPFNTPWDETPGQGDVAETAANVPDFAKECAARAFQNLAVTFADEPALKEAFEKALKDGAHAKNSASVPANGLRLIVNVISEEFPSWQTELRKQDRDSYFWHLNADETKVPLLAANDYRTGKWIMEVIASPKSCLGSNKTEMTRYLKFVQARLQDQY